MTGSGFNYSERRYIPISPETAVALAIKEGDFFVSRGNGSLHLLGRPVVAQEPPEQIVFPDTMIRLRFAIPSPFPRFVNYLWSGRLLRNQIEKKARTTAGIYKISQRDIESFRLPIPPIQEQGRIVAKIDELFSDLDAGVANLLRVRANLKRYRAAVLKAAVEGKLTEDWRAKHPDTEPASVLLERILIERRRKWEDDQRNKSAKARGQGPKGTLSKFNDPESPRLDDLHDLPVGWCWATIDQITKNFDGQRVPVKATDRAQRQGEYPYYGASGIIDQVDSFLFEGEFLLIAEDGANLFSRSTPIAFRASGRFWVNNHAHVVQLWSGVPLKYLEIFLNALDLKFSVTGSAQPKLTQASMNRIPVVLPPIQEQHELVLEVERRLSIVDEIEAQVEANLKRASRLRQGILKRAFEGRLVPQDPNDEPAEQLLARIRDQRQPNSPSTSGNPRSRRTGKPRKSGSATPLFAQDDGDDQGGEP